MTDTPIAAVVLVTGKGTRMGSDLHKVLHPLVSRPVFDHLLDSLDALGAAQCLVIVGAGCDQIERAFPDLKTAVQDPQLGTAHAVRIAEPVLRGSHGTVLVLYGDVPLVETTAIQRLCAAVDEDYGVAVLGFRSADTLSYGRLITGAAGRLQQIVENLDAAREQCAIGSCNTGIMALRAELLWPLLAEARDDNSKGKYYLTDIVALARAKGERIATTKAGEDEVTGVNSQAELAALEPRISNEYGAHA